MTDAGRPQGRGGVGIGVDVLRHMPPLPLHHERHPHWQLNIIETHTEQDAYDALEKFQAGQCWMCPAWKVLVMDHCHTTGLVRGLLCRSCNTQEGFGSGTPWWEWYREFPPAARLGIRVRYVNHLGRFVYDTRATMAQLATASDAIGEALGETFRESFGFDVAVPS